MHARRRAPRDLLPIEIKLFEALKAMSYEERYTAVALHERYLEVVLPCFEPGAGGFRRVTGISENRIELDVDGSA